MRVFKTRPIELLRVQFDVDQVGREVESVSVIGTIEANVQSSKSSFQVTLYGDRVRDMLTVYSNTDVDVENCRLRVDGLTYRIIGKEKYDAFAPTHYEYQLEIMHEFI